jgi:hypothetical protein
MRWLGSADFFDKERHEVLIETLTSGRVDEGAGQSLKCRCEEPSKRVLSNLREASQRHR